MRTLVVLATLLLAGLVNCALDNSGTEFVLCYMDNAVYGTRYDVELYITTVSNNPVLVNVTQPLYSSSWIRQINATRGNIVQVNVPSQIYGSGVEKSNKAVYISASEEVTVYSVNKQRFSTDAFVALPVDSLGTEYMAMTWTTVPTMMVVAVTDGTEVTFGLPASYANSFDYNGVTYDGGKNLTVSLNRFETFHIYSASGDFTGTTISSNHPLTAFSGSKKTKVTSTGTGSSSDHLVEQLMPTQSWGKEFVTFPTPFRTLGDFVRVLASESNTEYTLGSTTYTLAAAGEYRTHDVPADTYNYIRSNKGVVVGVFMKTVGTSSTGDGKLGGDPAMSYAVPIPLYGSDYTFSTVATTTGEFSNTLVVISHQSYTSDLVLDNANVTATWQPVTGSSDYVATYFNVTPGAHSIYNAVPAHGFLGMAMGNAQTNSYAYASGLRLAHINLPCSASSTAAGDGLDNDCDGKIDEETANGVDDDGDGAIDEDLAMAPRIDGNWGSWGNWGSCSTTCGGLSGTNTRTRACDNPASANFGLDCVGSGTETGNCNGPSNPCPINGNWGAWGSWASCSVTCGIGKQTRTKACDNPAPQHGGTNCTGTAANEDMNCTISAYCLPVFYGNPTLGCSNTTFGCAMGSVQCVDVVFRCDGKADCSDGSDESHFYTGCDFRPCESGAGSAQASLLALVISLVMYAVIKK